ncbi:MAG: tetratricopeptide repeat protein [Verrucomicrobiota bacterium]
MPSPRSSSSNPTTAEAWHERAHAHLEEKKHPEAAQAYQQALALDPNHVPSLIALARLTFNPQHPQQAHALLTRALDHDPENTDALALQGTFRFRLGDWARAEPALQKALALDPAHKEALTSLAELYMKWARTPEARDLFNRYYEAYPDDLERRSGALFVNHYFQPDNRADEFEAIRDWGKRLPQPDDDPPFTFPGLDRDPDRRLRIAYLSPDFRWHAVAHFALTVVENHNPDQVEVFCYSQNPKTDDYTLRFREAADHWIETKELSDEELRDRMREDRIDVLIELTGHTAGHRLGAVALRCAPVQAHWLGFCNSTGVPAMDYRLSDEVCDPPGDADRFSTEEITRLPGGFFTHLLPDEAPPVRPAPALRNGFLTFGCFNNHLKTNPIVLRLWTQLLQEVPDSRLLLRYSGYDNAYLRQSVTAFFEEAGIASERLRLLSGTPAINQYYDLYGQIDIALDPFPYNGMTTSCECCWMGVPFVTMADDVHRSRVGATILTQINHPEWIAHSPEEYLTIAKDLAADPKRLNNLRPEIRTAMEESSLGDGKGMAGKIETAARNWWQRWLQQEPKAP